MEWNLFQGDEKIVMVMGTFYPSNDDVTLFKPIEWANELDLAATSQVIATSASLIDAIGKRRWSFVVQFDNNVYAVQGGQEVMHAFDTTIKGTKQQLLEEFEDDDDDLEYVLHAIEMNKMW